MALDVLQGRPVIENTPSGLKRITRFKKLNAEGAKQANLSTYFDAYGTADVEFTTALLVEQRIDRRSEQGIDVSLVKVYQELADNALTATTEVTESTAFDGRRVTRTTYLCRAEDAATLRPAIGSGSPAVFQVDVEINGPVAKVITSAIAITDAGFVLSTSDDERNNGALLIRTIRTVGGAPSTPSGFTRVSYSSQQVDGYTVYNYSFAKGLGEISRDIDYSQSSDQGTTGLTRTTIRYLVAPAGTIQPTTLSGSVLVGQSVSEADGHRVWTTVWAKGTGTIRTNVSQRNNGKLTVIRATALGAYPTAPTTNGFLASISVTGGGSAYATVPTVTITGGGGTGATATAVITANVVTSITLNTPGTGYTSAPTVTITGGGGSGATATAALVSISPVETDASIEQQDGVVLYTKEWAAGSGVIDVRTDARGDGLRTETWVSLGPTYDASFMLPAGVLLVKDSSEEEGTKRWVVTCIQNASGTSPLVGTTVASVEIVNIGNTSYVTAPTVTFSGGGGSGAAATATIDGSGFVTGITVTNAGTGYTSAPLVTLSPGNSDTPTCVAILANGAITQEKLMRFTYPGRAKAIALQHPDESTAYNLDAQLSPPIEATILGSEEVSYRSDNSLSDLTYPLWAPTEWATVFAQYVDGSAYVSKCEGLRGYRAVVNSGGTTWVSRTTTSGYTSVLGNPVTNVSGKSAYLRVFGGPDAPDGQTFTLDAECELAFIGYDGTRYYRRIVRYATIPTQNAMPDLTTAGIAIISSSVTNTTTLKAVTTAGVTVGGRTNAFRYTWTQGGVIFVRTVRATLAAGTLAADTTFYIKPTDYDASTNAKYWVLA